MQQGVARGVFPGGVLYVRADNRLWFHEAYGEADIFTHQAMTRDTVFDLASLTKPLATAPAVLKLVRAGRLTINDQLGDILAEFHKTDKHDITLAQLLEHTSGLPAHRDYFLTLAGLAREKRDGAMLRMLVKEPLEYAPGKKQVYSDLGYMVLKYVVEAVSKKRLDIFVHDELYVPLDIDDLFFINLDSSLTSAAAFSNGQFAATEDCPRRRRLIKGMVHDDNAYEAGGIGGQAGLFGTTAAVAFFLNELLSIYRGEKAIDILSRETVKLMMEPRPGSKRTCGFDTPDRENSSAGSMFSRTAVGHLGFTGVSIWLDIISGVMILLFTNRIHPHRNNDAIKKFRPLLHDAVMAELSGRAC